MTELYSNKQLSAVKSSIKRFVCVAILTVLVAFVLCMVVCFFADRSNAYLLKLVNIIVSAISGCIAIYLLLNNILPLVARKNYIEQLLFSASKTVVGVVESVGVQFTISKNVCVKEINVANKQGNTVLYWDEQIAFPDICGKHVVFRAVNNRIVAYEILNESCN